MGADEVDEDGNTEQYLKCTVSVRMTPVCTSGKILETYRFLPRIKPGTAKKVDRL